MDISARATIACAAPADTGIDASSNTTQTQRSECKVPLGGYKRPPLAHRFRKGQSGNPNGRPRKHPQAASKPSQNDIDDLCLDEAYRPVSIRENGKTIKMPAIQAAMRGLTLAAIKGDRRAQLALREHTQAIEQKKRDDRAALFKKAMAYKDDWAENFKRYDAAGIPRPDPLPHPDDIKFDSDNCVVSFVGPKDEFQKAKWDMLHDVKRKVGEQVALMEKRIRRRPSLYDELEEEFTLGRQFIEMIEFYYPDETVRRAITYKHDLGRPPDISAITRAMKEGNRTKAASLEKAGDIRSGG